MKLLKTFGLLNKKYSSLFFYYFVFYAIFSLLFLLRENLLNESETNLVSFFLLFGNIF